MKKFYFLAVLMITATLGIAQGLENFNNSNATGSYSDNSFTGENGISWSYVASRNENGDANGSGIDGNALMLRRTSDGSQIESGTISGGIGSFSIKLYKGFTGGGNRQVEVFVNDMSKGTSVAFDDFNEHVFTIDNINVAGDIVIKIKNITAKQVIIDDISWTAFAGAATPGLSINSPSDNSTIYTLPGVDAEINLDFAISNFDLATDGRVIIRDFDGSGIFVPTQSSPIVLQDYVNVGLGNHSVTLELQDSENNYLTPPVQATINFSVAEIEDVADISSLRAKTPDDGKVYRITGETLIIHQTIGSSKRLWVRDDTGSILVYLENNTSTDDEIGLIYKNAVGSLESYNGLLEFIPSEAYQPDLVSSGNTINPINVSLTDINSGTYESNLVKLVNVNIVDISGGDGTFQSGKNYTVINSSAINSTEKRLGENIVLRTGFYDADYIGESLPTTSVDLVSIVGNYKGTYQITPRSSSDIISAALNNDLFKEAYVSIYPIPAVNNLTFKSNINTIGNFKVYSIDGQLIINTKGNLSNKSLDVSKLAKGSYILKVSNDNNFQVYKFTK